MSATDARTPDEDLQGHHHRPFLIEDFSSLKPLLVWCYEGEVYDGNRDFHSAERHTVAWLMLKGSVVLETRAEGAATATVAGAAAVAPAPVQRFTAGPGQWLFFGPADRHQRFSPDAAILSLSFRLEWPSGDPLIDRPVMLSARDFPALARTARPIARLVHKHFPNVRAHLWKCGTDLVHFFEMQRLFSAWLVAYLRAMVASGGAPSRAPGIDPRVLDAVRKLDRHVWTEPFREESLATEAGLSIRHLNRLFLQHLGLTPRAYLQKCRLRLATALLSDHAIPIKQIAYELGFSSPNHFSNWFREAVGKSPRECRQSPHRSCSSQLSF